MDHSRSRCQVQGRDASLDAESCLESRETVVFWGGSEASKVRITMTEKQLRQLKVLLSDHVHLTNEEIECYIVGNLDTESRVLVASHLEACPYCSKEVELIREACAEPDPGFSADSDTRKPGISPVPRPDSAAAYDRFWLGHRSYPLAPYAEFPEIAEIVGLSRADLLIAYQEDLREPGSVPIGVESLEQPPIVGSLSDFRRESKPYRRGEDAFSSQFADVLKAMKSRARVIELRRPIRRTVGTELRKTGTAASARPPSANSDDEQATLHWPDVVLAGYARGRGLEIIGRSPTERIFLKIFESGHVQSCSSGESSRYGDFSLDWEAASTLVSLQFDLVREDVESTSHPRRLNKKIKWLENWMSRVQTKFGNLGWESSARQILLEWIPTVFRPHSLI